METVEKETLNDGTLSHDGPYLMMRGACIAKCHDVNTQDGNSAECYAKTIAQRWNGQSLLAAERGRREEAERFVRYFACDENEGGTSIPMCPVCNMSYDGCAGFVEEDGEDCKGYRARAFLAAAAQNLNENRPDA